MEESKNSKVSSETTTPSFISPASVIPNSSAMAASNQTVAAAAAATTDTSPVQPQQLHTDFASLAAAAAANGATFASESSTNTSTSTSNTNSNLTQNFENEEQQEEVVEDAVEDNNVLMGSGEYNLVGIRYYKGVAHPGEFVTLHREPFNPYDRNAIRIDNMHGEKVGHIKRESAAKLAPLMDNHSDLFLEGSIPRSGNAYQLPLQVDFYCVQNNNNIDLSDVTSSSRNHGMDQQIRTMFKKLQSSLKYDYNFRFSPAFGGQPPSKTKVEAIRPTQEIKKVDWDVQSKELDEMFDKQCDKQLKELPDLDMPIQFKDTVTLYQHQIDGMRWLVHQENKMNASNGKVNNPFFKQVYEGKGKKWLCEITQCSQSYPPSNFSGSILADEMGLGKTLQTIGLILLSPPNGNAYPEGTNDDEPQKMSAEEINQSEEGKDNTPIPADSMIRSQKAAILKSILKAAGLKLSGKKSDQIDRILAGIKDGKITGSHFPAFMTAPPPPTPSASSSFGSCTLIVCPVSVMSNWEVQIDSFVKRGVLNVRSYHGQDRHELLPLLQSGKIDVLIVSYSTLSSEFKNAYPELDKVKMDGPPTKRTKQSSLFDVSFHRIILDEAHTIRNDTTRYYKAVKKVDAERKLALTGTPFVNKADDMFSLFAFIGIEPFSDKSIFKRAITQPMKNGDDIGLSRLRTAMSYVALRRGKSKVAIKLAEKEVQIRSIQFPENDKNQEIYQALFGTLKLALQAVLQDGGEGSVLTNYSSILEKILRLRQTCCSATLVDEKRRAVALKMWQELQESKNGKKLSKEDGLKLLEKLKGTLEEDESPECPVCLMEMEEQDMRVLRCGHVYCFTCMNRMLLTSSKQPCPVCRADFTKADVIDKKCASAAALQSPVEKNDDSEIGTSPKVLALLDAINSMKPDEKGVIFSQFTKFLDIIENKLTAAGIRHTRIDGSKSPQKRLEAVKAFSSNDADSPRFVLCSLRAAGTGINLTRGNYAFMMDCWWNESIENQAMDRVHRIGQKRKVTIIRYVMKDSIEERIIALQQAKSLQAKGAMEKLSNEEKRKARLDQLKGLLSLSDGDEN